MEEKRTYYRKTWGFDPVEVAVPLGGERWKFEAQFELPNDHLLHLSGVRLCARVVFSRSKKAWRDLGLAEVVKNTIVFRFGDVAAEAKGREFEVNCVHSVVYAISQEELADLRLDDYEELLQSTEGKEAVLPPEEHFAALVSFVSAMAEVGVEEFLRSGLASEVLKSAIRRTLNSVLEFIAKHSHNGSLLVELAGSEGKKIRRAALQNPHLPGEFFEGLRERMNLETAFAAYRHPNCPPDLRMALAGVQAVRFVEKFFKSANMDAWLLLARLLGEVTGGDLTKATGELSEEAVKSELVDALLKQNVRRLLKLAKAVSGPAWLFSEIKKAAIAAGEHELTIHSAFVANPNAPHFILEEVARRGWFIARVDLALSPTCPPDLLDFLSRRKVRLVRLAAARNPRTPEAALERLTRQGLASDLGLAAAALGNPSCPPSAFALVGATNQREALPRFASAFHLDLGLLTAASANRDDDVDLLLRAAGSWRTSRKMLEVLSGSLTLEVREDVAKNFKTPRRTLRLLARDPVPCVRWAVEKNKRSLGSIRKAAKLAEPVPVMFRSEGLLNSDNPLPILLVGFAHDVEVALRYKVAAHGRCPVVLLRKLASDDEPAVREAVAQNPNTPTEILEELKSDHDALVREAADKRLKQARENDSHHL
ncbi:MAG: hypothetical protein Kow0069_11610 [Promethearchaeota archaeon]